MQGVEGYRKFHRLAFKIVSRNASVREYLRGYLNPAKMMLV